MGDAAEALQLGFYLLAAQSDPAISALGEPVEAEFWYPAMTNAKKMPAIQSETSWNQSVRCSTEAADGIRAEEWGYRPGPHCRTCRVRVVCPAWPEGREAYAR